MRDFSYWNFLGQKKSENRNENECEVKVSFKKSIRLDEGLNGRKVEMKVYGGEEPWDKNVKEDKQRG